MCPECGLIWSTLEAAVRLSLHVSEQRSEHARPDETESTSLCPGSLCQVIHGHRLQPGHPIGGTIPDKGGCISRIAATACCPADCECGSPCKHDESRDRLPESVSLAEQQGADTERCHDVRRSDHHVERLVDLWELKC